jgi:DNA-binding GntR family transcriptional regulator
MPMSHLDIDDPRAYVRMALVVRDRIADETFPVGRPVPITTLVQEHGHARLTCAKALRLLVDDELLFLVPGLGYYVAKGAAERLRDSATEPEAATPQAV